MADQEKVASIYVQLELDQANYEKGFAAAQATAQRAAARIKAQGAEAAGGLRLISEEFGVHMPRALLSFTSKLPGVSQAISAAFNTVAVLALAGILVDVGKKVYEVAQGFSDTSKAAKEYREQILAITTSESKSNDERQLSNDLLRNEIAKLEHKPQNNLAVALDQSRVDADNLYASLKKSTDEVTKLFESKRVGFFGQFIQAKNADIVDKVEGYNNQITATTQAGQAKINAATTPAQSQAASKALNDSIQKIVSDAIAYTNLEIEKRTTGDTNGLYRFANGRQDKNVQSLTDAKNIFTGIGNQARLDFDGNSLKAQDTALKTNLENQKDYQEQKFKLDEAALENQKQFKESFSQVFTPQDDAKFWQGHIAEFKKGSDQFNTIQTKIISDNIKFNTDLVKSFKEALKLQSEPVPESKAQSDDSLIQARARDAEATAKNNVEYSETVDRLRLASGAISQYTFALDQSKAHALDYQNQLAALNKELADLQKNFFTGDNENLAKQQGVQTSINSLQAKAQIEGLKDTNDVVQNSLSGLINSVFDELKIKAQNTAAEIRNITQETISSLNNEFAKAVTGQRTDFRGVARSTSQGLAKTGFQALEGGIIGSLGLGKRDGSTSGQALFVQLAQSSPIPGLGAFASALPNVRGPNGQSAGGTALKAGTGILGAVLGSLNDSDFASSLFGGHLFGSGSIFGGGGFATGGLVYPGQSYKVGENGTEEFRPTVPGRIIPHTQLNSGHTINNYITGTDPVLTEKAVARGMKASYQASVHTSQQQIQEKSRRVPR